MRYFLMALQTSQPMSDVSRETAKITGPAGLRALSLEETIEKGLMPRTVELANGNGQKGVRKLVYVDGSGSQHVLVDYSSVFNCLACDAKYDHVVCGSIEYQYQYTWYEVPDGKEVGILFRWEYETPEGSEQIEEIKALVSGDGVLIVPDSGGRDAQEESMWKALAERVYCTTWRMPSGWPE